MKKHCLVGQGGIATFSRRQAAQRRRELVEEAGGALEVMRQRSKKDIPKERVRSCDCKSWKVEDGLMQESAVSYMEYMLCRAFVQRRLTCFLKTLFFLRENKKKTKEKTQETPQKTRKPPRNTSVLLCFFKSLNKNRKGLNGWPLGLLNTTWRPFQAEKTGEPLEVREGAKGSKGQGLLTQSFKFFKFFFVFEETGFQKCHIFFELQQLTSSLTVASCCFGSVACLPKGPTLWTPQRAGGTLQSRPLRGSGHGRAAAD